VLHRYLLVVFDFTQSFKVNLSLQQPYSSRHMRGKIETEQPTEYLQVYFFSWPHPGG